MTTVPAAVDSNLLHRLADPFTDDEVEWRVARAGIKHGRPWAQVLAYIDARAARARLNAVVGPTNWRIEYAEGPRGGVIATLSLRVGNEWIAKSDGADITEREPVKGALSNAFKRSCAVWGIGEHLYDVGESWAIFTDSGAHRVQIEGTTYRWDAPSLARTNSRPGRRRAGNAQRRTSTEFPQDAVSAATSAQYESAVESVATMRMPFGKHRGVTLRDIPLAELRSARDWAIQKKREYPEFVEAVAVLERSDPVAALQS